MTRAGLLSRHGRSVHALLKRALVDSARCSVEGAQRAAGSGSLGSYVQTAATEVMPSECTLFSQRRAYGLTRLNECRVSHHGIRALSSQATNSEKAQKEKDSALVQDEGDAFDSLTDRIPEKPVSVAEAGGYGIVILAAFGVAGVAAYSVFKELVLEPTEYRIFDIALKRVQQDSQVLLRVEGPISGYGSESQNRAARQRIPHREYVDKSGNKHVAVQFHIRGRHGAGVVTADMYQDNAAGGKEWKYAYLTVEITAPYPTQIILEPPEQSYVERPAK
eukprot:jgi/Mesvir1/12445/Mv26543-RA.1